jgi:nucleoside-diphosphate-sugar epimerase
MAGATAIKILVTGGRGYIGEPTTRALVARGCDVHVLGRTDPSIAGATFHHADLLQVVDMRDAIEQIGAETLLHLAWSVTPGKFWTDSANRDWAVASRRLFDAFARSGGRRIVGAGSCAEYDWSASPLIEFSSSIGPATPYGQAKASVWSGLQTLGIQEGLPVAWARLFFLYGPHEPRGKLVADAVNALLSGQVFQTTPGLQKRDFMYVEDAAEALAELALSSITGPVNVASGQGITVRELLEEVEAETRSAGLIQFGARALADREPLELVADVTRLREEVGFVPEFSIAEGLKRTVEWWRKQSSIGTCA